MADKRIIDLVETVRAEDDDFIVVDGSLGTRKLSAKKAGGSGASSAENVSYDNFDSGLEAENVKDAIDELNDIKAPVNAVLLPEEYRTEDVNTATDYIRYCIQNGILPNPNAEQKLVKIMNDYAYNNQLAFSTEEGTYNPRNWYAWKPFNDSNIADTSSVVQSWGSVQNNVFPKYLGIILSRRSKVTRFDFASYWYGSENSGVPKDFELEGSDDTTDGFDGTWESIQSYSNSVNQGHYTFEFEVSNPKFFKAYRLKFNSTHDSRGIVIIRNFNLYGI